MRIPGKGKAQRAGQKTATLGYPNTVVARGVDLSIGTNQKAAAVV
jgi:hypothetical protein